MAAYIIHDLPRAVPHNIATKFAKQLTTSRVSGTSGPRPSFSTIFAESVSAESRLKIQRTTRQLQNRFTVQVEEARREVQAVLEGAEREKACLNVWKGLENDVVGLKTKVSDIDLSKV